MSISICPKKWIVEFKISSKLPKDGIEKLCLSSLGTWEYEPSFEVCVKANREVKEAMEKYPGRIIGFCYINPALGETGLEEFRKCVRDYGMRGLKLWVAVKKCNDQSVDPFIDAAVEYDVPVLQHAWLKSTGNLPNESTPRDVSEMALKHLDATIIMAHITGEWETGATYVRDYKNVLVDTCGTICDARMVEHAVKLLGAERVVYGSDNRDFAGQAAKILSAEIADHEEESIFSGNARRIIDI
ncbi:MAG: amidohydrolase family protein [Thermoproteota archaeon]